MLLSKEKLSSQIIPNLKSLRFKVLTVKPKHLNYALNLPNIQLADQISFAIGLITACGIAYKLYQNYLKSRKEEAKPIFHKELTTRINEITQATYNIEKHKGYFQNVLLYGPGGTGKTMIAKQIARNSNINYVMMSGGDLAQYIKRKEHVTELNKLMERVQNSTTPTILFIDEAESLTRDRDITQSPEHIELLNAFLSHTGEASKKMIIILATNRIEDIDPAVLSRMDHKLYIGPPEDSERVMILEQYIRKFFTDQEIKEFLHKGKIQEISQKIDGFTGRTIFKMVNALLGSKNASNNNKLTNAMIDKTVSNFVQQEKELERLRNRKNKKSAEVLIAGPIIETKKPQEPLHKKIGRYFLDIKRNLLDKIPRSLQTI